MHALILLFFITFQKRRKIWMELLSSIRRQEFNTKFRENLFFFLNFYLIHAKLEKLFRLKNNADLSEFEIMNDGLFRCIYNSLLILKIKPKFFLSFFESYREIPLCFDSSNRFSRSSTIRALQ